MAVAAIDANDTANRINGNALLLFATICTCALYSINLELL